MTMRDAQAWTENGAADFSFETPTFRGSVAIVSCMIHRLSDQPIEVAVKVRRTDADRQPGNVKAFNLLGLP